MTNKFSTKHIAIAAGLSALSATLQLNHVGYQSPTWGMWIDIVAVTWIVAYFLFGFRMSLLVSIMGAVVITLFSPDTWLGASMKFVATIPIIFSLVLWQKIYKNIKVEKYRNTTNLIIPLVVGIAARCLVVLPLNYFYAIPIWTKMTPSAAWAAIPWYIIAGFNAVQTIVDVGLAWVLVYRFKLDRYGRHIEHRAELREQG
jgi:riboflavin transporter FmnP